MAFLDAILNYSKDGEDDFYKLLGCDENSSTEQINAEYKARVLSLHPDKNPDDPKAGEKFKKFQTAKETLTDPEKRKKYDSWRHSGLRVPYTQWLSMRSQVHTSMHWAVNKKKDLMLKDATTSKEECKQENVHKQAGEASGVVWLQKEQRRQETPDELLVKFRNYEI